MAETMLNEMSYQPILAQIKDIHEKYPLSGDDQQSFFNLPDGLQVYLLALMRDDAPCLPVLPEDEWYKLLQSLRPHWILPLIYNKVVALPVINKPSENTVYALKQEYYRSKIISSYCDKQLKEILEVFKTEGIRILVLKGSALARLTYSDPALRPSSDIDLLVKPIDMVRSRRLMEKIGYICEEQCFEYSLGSYSEELYLRPGNRIYKPVEIHWKLHPYCMEDVNNLFDRAVNVVTYGLEFETLDPIDTLIYNAMHMLMHHNTDIRLNWIYDTFLLIKNLKTRDDWIDLQKRSKIYGARIAVEVSLTMAERWTGVKIPSEYQDFSLWPAPEQAEIIALERAQLSRSDHITDKFKFTWYCSTSPIDKIHVIWFMIFPPKNVIRNCYPEYTDWLIPVNYVRRWFSLVSRLLFSIRNK